MLLVDTNVLAYLLLEGEQTAAAQKLRQRDPDWRSESLILVEFSNVLASSMAIRGLRRGVAQELLAAAVSLLDDKLARVPHHEALAVAAQFATTAYDARFLTLARLTGLQLVTEDRKLRRAAPSLTQSITDALARA